MARIAARVIVRLPRMRFTMLVTLRSPMRWAVGLLLLLGSTVSALAQPVPTPARDRGETVATATSETASFSQRAAGEMLFSVLPQGAELQSGNLLVGLPGAKLRSQNDAVDVTFRADFGGHSPLPILETAVLLHDSPQADLTLTLDRGRIDMTNRKPTGSATVVIRFQDHEWKVVLEQPGSRVVVETIGRWAPGTPLYKADPPKDHAPITSVVLLLLKGTAQVSDRKVTLALSAPPGPAMVSWTSTDPTPLAAMKLESLPAWATATPSTPAERAEAAAIEKFRELRAVSEAVSIDRFLHSTDPVERRVGLIAAGALDSLDQVSEFVRSAQDVESCELAISVLRHWLGRGRGQDLALYQYLREQRYSPAEAETIIYLLHGLPPADFDRPETYAVLIEYLLNNQAAIRNLAAWHLARLAPAGKTIPWKPNGTVEEFQPVQAAWKKRIPAGQLPRNTPTRPEAPPGGRTVPGRSP
ncbi:MAG: hypothetical protein LC104_04835 [Bacteroidales bacterium]|nr:hypothetical protein [Bacteroidales bacterium]